MIFANTLFFTANKPVTGFIEEGIRVLILIHKGTPETIYSKIQPKLQISMIQGFLYKAIF